MVEKLKAPFPWFGGKSRVTDIVWARLGNPEQYLEPFFGSGAVLFGRPHAGKVETINDKDCFVANFWRALQADPEQVAHYADSPVNEADLHARHLWLVQQDEWQEKMKTDPEYFDARIAGWWVWGLSAWIGTGWCANWGAKPSRQVPHLRTSGSGVHRQELGGGTPGRLHRKIPHIRHSGSGVHRAGFAGEGVSMQDYMQRLAARLRRVLVCCGDWKRICGGEPSDRLGITGVFLDPPYGGETRRGDEVYATDDMDVSAEVRAWAIERGEDPYTRIALCGYEGEHVMPKGWRCFAWKATGGYGNQGTGDGRNNARRERIWFSPYCLDGKQWSLGS